MAGMQPGTAALTLQGLTLDADRVWIACVRGTCKKMCGSQQAQRRWQAAAGPVEVQQMLLARS